MIFRKGEQVLVMNTSSKLIGKAVVNYYSISEKKYSVFFHYPNTGEYEEISLPEWMILKHPPMDSIYTKAMIKTGP